MKTRYCNYDSCPAGDGTCEFCDNEITVDRTFADTIDVVLNDGYRQKFWVDLTDTEAIERCLKMRSEGIKPY
jgi:hypothetical protein